MPINPAVISKNFAMNKDVELNHYCHENPDKLAQDTYRSL